MRPPDARPADTAAPPSTARWVLAALVLALGCAASGTWALSHGVRLGGLAAFSPALEPWPYLDMWVRWDSRWFLQIAREGYDFQPGAQSSVAFFPLYPLAVRAVALLGLSPELAGIAVNLACGLGAVALFHRWALRVGGPSLAGPATLLLVLWPFAFFLYGAVYSDALFLLLVVGAFLQLERGAPLSAALLGALATATRPLAPAVVLGLLARQLELRLRAGQRPGPRDALPLLSAAGLLAYALYQQLRFGNPLAFLDAQAGWDQSVGPASWLKPAFFLGGQWRQYGRYGLPNAACALLFLGLLPAVRQRLGWGYALYTALAVGIPFLVSHAFVGLGRYALAGFPCFLALAAVLSPRPRLRALYLAGSGVLLALLAAKFAIGRFVA